MSAELIKEESKKLDRHPIAKVRVTWTDPFIDQTIEVTPENNNRASYPKQVADLITDVPKKWLQTNSPIPVVNNGFFPAPSSEEEAVNYQVGWRGSVMSEHSGYFNGLDASITVKFSARPLIGFVVAGDSAIEEYPVWFYVKALRIQNGTTTELETVEVNNNDQVLYSGEFQTVHPNATHMQLIIMQWSRPFATPKIAEFYSSIVKEYYNDDIVRLSILEETDGSVGTIPVGNISCNEMDLSLQNIDDKLFPANIEADLHRLVKKNRKMEPFLGFNIDGVDYYKPHGLYWSGDWDVRDEGTTADTSARDRMELLRNLIYNGLDGDPNTPAEATYWTGSTLLRSIATTIFNSIKEVMPDFFWAMDNNFGMTSVSLAFFRRQSYFDILKKIAQAGLGFIYFDTPTEAERAGNPLMKDILRVRAFGNFYPNVTSEQEAKDLEAYEVITKDDYITRNNPAKSEELKNIVNVKIKSFEIDSETGLPKEIGETIYTHSDETSISENGSLPYDYPDNELIQNVSFANLISQNIVREYKQPRKDIELSAFGNPDMSIGKIIESPEYQKNNIDIRSKSVINRIQFEFDGSLRAEYNCRRVGPIYNASNYKWEMGDGTTLYGDEVEYLYNDPGVYTAKLTVTDGDDVDSRTALVRVNEALEVVSIDWDFDDGNTGSGVEVDHTYQSAGVYNPEQTVTGSDGGTDTETEEIIVT